MRNSVSLIALMACCVLAARPLPAQDAPKPTSGDPATIAGAIKDLPADGGKAVAAFGHQGCMVIRSASRWEPVREKLLAAGWKPKNKDDLAKVDFEKRQVVLLFNFGDEASEFSLHRFIPGQKATLDIVMSYIIYKSRGAVVNNFNFILTAVPKSEELTVTVSTYHPQNGGPHPTADQATLDWKAAFSSDSGDIGDGLQGVIHAKEQTVKAGEDILVDFTLSCANPVVVKNGVFARQIQPPKVWDGKYSNGFRNHAFEVTTPDGKRHFLRPEERDWRKNIPHPEEVTPEKPYVLPEWREGTTAKSLKALGLDTSNPGTYTITGLYAQTGEEAQVNGKPVALWGGDIATNTITVKVTKD